MDQQLLDKPKQADEERSPFSGWMLEALWSCVSYCYGYSSHCSIHRTSATSQVQVRAIDTCQSRILTWD